MPEAAAVVQVKGKNLEQRETCSTERNSQRYYAGQLLEWSNLHDKKLTKNSYANDLPTAKHGSHCDRIQRKQKQNKAIHLGQILMCSKFEVPMGCQGDFQLFDCLRIKWIYILEAYYAPRMESIQAGWVMRSTGMNIEAKSNTAM